MKCKFCNHELELDAPGFLNNVHTSDLYGCRNCGSLFDKNLDTGEITIISDSHVCGLCDSVICGECDLKIKNIGDEE
jgi:hypothetical protein